jgi:predicted ATPase/class 3 adenylate cyclase
MITRDLLERAIALLETQRAELGDEVVELALEPLRQRLNALVTPTAGEERKLVTILFSDLVGFTASSSKMDPEEVSDIMKTYFAHMAAVITHHGGAIEKYIGDAIMAVFGLPVRSEDDEERAVQAALEMQQALEELNDEMEHQHSLRLTARIGLNTGIVLAGFIGRHKEDDFTVVGDIVNTASRIQSNAPPGGVLIAHETFRHVRGLFEVIPQPPLTVKGKTEPIQTYLVQHARQRTFDVTTRGVEGIQTRMVGRQAQLADLQIAWRAVLQGEGARLVTVTGEAGVGKSRLVHEFIRWLELPEAAAQDALHFRGRAFPQMVNIPYSLLRDVFRDRFDILDSDRQPVVQRKFEAGMRAHLDADQAHLVGQLLGFDFSNTQAVKNLAGSAAFAAQARLSLSRYFQGITAGQPTLMFLEDIHWGDTASLDFVSHLVEENSGQRLLLVALSRPTLYERLPNWGRGFPATRIDVRPLEPDDSRALVNDILQKVDRLPPDVRDLIVQNAEGNPFYVEELIKMLIDDGVILRGEDCWQVGIEHLKRARIPTTLTGVLQARLDSLPVPEKEILQRAAVIGRHFWDDAVEWLLEQPAEQRPDVPLDPTLNAVLGRELVFREGRSAFSDAKEFIFKHALLRDVTYETVLLKLRRVYHRQAALWLETHSGERANEYAGLIADHYVKASDNPQAVAWLNRLAQAAYHSSAFRESIAAQEQILALTPANNLAERAQALDRIGSAYEKLCEYPEAIAHAQAGLSLARQIGELKIAVSALTCLTWVNKIQGNYQEAKNLAEEAYQLACQSGDKLSIARALTQWSDFAEDDTLQLHQLEEIRAIYTELDNRSGLATTLLNLGNFYFNNKNDLDQANRYYQSSLAIYREVGNRWGIANCLNNLGGVAHRRGNLAGALPFFEEGLAVSTEIGDREGIVLTNLNLGAAHTALKDDQRAWEHLTKGLTLALETSLTPLVLSCLVGLARLLARRGELAHAGELVGLALTHPATNDDVASHVTEALAELRPALPADELQAAQERGQGLDLETVSRALLER